MASSTSVKHVTSHANTPATKMSAFLSDELKELIFTDILDGIIAKVPTTDSTREIAAKHNVSVMSVAGIRSAYTKGQYGSPKYLVRKRREQLRGSGQL